MFHDDLKVTTHLARRDQGRDKYGRLVQSGPSIGIDVYVPCPECSTVNKVRYSWDEVFHLLKGGQVQGVQPDDQGWRAAVTCQKSNCQNMQGRTAINYRLFYDDLRRHANNLQAGRRQVPQVQQMQQGQGGPYGNQGGGQGGGWPFG